MAKRIFDLELLTDAVMLPMLKKTSPADFAGGREECPCLFQSPRSQIFFFTDCNFTVRRRLEGLVLPSMGHAAEAGLKPRASLATPVRSDFNSSRRDTGSNN